MSEAVDAKQAPLDVITIGRASVDLYGQQIGSRLEDITSFAKSVGGSPTNMAWGGEHFDELYVANLARTTITRAKAGRRGQRLANQLPEPRAKA